MSDNSGIGRRPSFIYHPNKAIEHVLGRMDIEPVRFFAVFFPLWAVEIEGEQRDSRRYQIIENYVERGILNGGLQSTDELASFFGMETQLVKKVVTFLSAIGHIEDIQGRLRLTRLGVDSLERMEKYVLMETRRQLYFDGILSNPLISNYYDSKSIRFLAEDEIPAHSMGIRFFRLLPTSFWNIDKLYELERRPDKDKYNIPHEVTNIRQRSAPESIYTPMYIFETRRQGYSNPYYVTYTGIKERHDLFFEEIVNNSPPLLTSLYAEEEISPSQLWFGRITANGLPTSRLTRLPNGSWQLRLLSSDLQSASESKALLAALGSYWIEKGYFLHIWCNDERIRREAAISQILKRVEKKKRTLTNKELDELLMTRADTLKVPELSRTDLLNKAKELGFDKTLSTLENLYL